MTHEEKLLAVKKMQDEAKNYHQEKIDRLGVNKSEKLTAEVIQNEQNLNKNAKFLQKINKESYMESDLNLAERLDRGKHYRGKYKE